MKFGVNTLRNKAIVLDFTYLVLFRNDSGWSASEGRKPTLLLRFDSTSASLYFAGSEVI